MPDEPPLPTYFGVPPRSLDHITARLRMFARAAIRLVASWVRVCRELVSLRMEYLRLAWSRRRLQYDLGGAVLAEDEPRVADLRRRLQVCVEEQERLRRVARFAVAHARSKTSEERTAAARTRIIPPSS